MVVDDKLSTPLMVVSSTATELVEVLGPTRLMPPPVYTKDCNPRCTGCRFLCANHVT